MFHRGHYNKVAALLGRRAAVHIAEDDKQGFLAIESIGTSLCIMFSEDNSNFDVDVFAAAVGRHASEYLESFGIVTEDERELANCVIDKRKVAGT